MKVQIVKFLTSKGKIVEMRKSNFKGKYLPENILEEYEVEIKGEDSKESNRLEDLTRKYATGNYILLWKANSKLENPSDKDSIWTICDRYVDKDYWDYKLIHIKHKDILERYLKNPSVEIETGVIAPMTGETEPIESERLKDLFLNDKAECLVGNEQEFRLVYNFLNKTRDKRLNRFLKLDGSFDFTLYNNKFPIIITTNIEWGYLYEWDRLKDRDLTKPLIKFDGEIFWEVYE